MLNLKTLIVFLLLCCTGCATIHRHPTLTKVTIISAGAGTGVLVGILTRRANECPSIITGNPYSGTPVGGKCPEYWPPQWGPKK